MTSIPGQNYPASLPDPAAVIAEIAPVFGMKSADVGQWALVLVSADGDTTQVASGPDAGADPGQASRLLTLGADLAARIS